MVFTTISATSGRITYVFEGVIKIEENNSYFALEINGANGGFYIIGDSNKSLVENFWSSQLNPAFVSREDSPWIGATGGIDYWVDGEYFKALVKKWVGREAPDDLYKYNWAKEGLPSTEFITFEFIEKVADISNKLQINPDDLMSVMAFESWFNPAAKNPNGIKHNMARDAIRDCSYEQKDKWNLLYKAKWLD